MSDRFSTSIDIGGAISDPTLRKLARVIRNAQFGFSWGDELSGHEEVDEVVQMIREYLENNDGCLSVVCIECPGEEDITEFCRAHNLPYCKRVEAKYEFDGEIRWWIPGMEEEHFEIANAEGNEPLVSVQEAVEFIENKIKQAGYNADEILYDTLTMLRSKQPPVIMRLMPC